MSHCSAQHHRRVERARSIPHRDRGDHRRRNRSDHLRQRIAPGGNDIGRIRGPRTCPPAHFIGSRSLTWNSGMRSIHTRIATVISSRARFDPAQRWSSSARRGPGVSPCLRWHALEPSRPVERMSLGPVVVTAGRVAMDSTARAVGIAERDDPVDGRPCGTRRVRLCRGRERADDRDTRHCGCSSKLDVQATAAQRA